MAYKYSVGRRDFGDIDYEGDDNTQIDFDADYIALVTNGISMLDVSGSSVGIGTTTPDYTLDVAGDIGVNQYIYHNGDANTWINFTDNRIRLNAGGNNFIDCEDPGSAPHKVRINNGGNNIDFVIKDNSNNVYFTADASTSRVGIGIDTPTAILHVSQSADPGGDNSLFRVDAFSQTNPAIDIKDNGTESYVGINREAGTNALTVEPHSAGSLAIRVTNGHLGTTQDNYGLKIGTAGKTLVHDATDFVFDDSLKVSGDTNVTGQFARGVASVNLGSGTTSTLNPATSGAGTLLVTASSITTPTGGAANEGMHICSLADGTIAGQVLTIIIVSIMFWFLNKTKTGKSMRAYSDNEDLALLSGIDPKKVVMITWIIAGILATIGGVLYGLDKSYRPFVYFNNMLPIFAAAIVGGIGNPFGAFLGGYVIAFAEIFLTYAYKRFISYLLPESLEPNSLLQLLSTDYKFAISFSILVIVLLVRPSGIFKGKTL